MSIPYRKDIDGLRAIAVIPVVLFHSGIPFFEGGYVGVDVFFVISGYLITQILLKQLNEYTFSISTFYERRIRRIFPALFAVLLVSSVAAIWLMFPSEFRHYKQSVLSTLFFYSNYFFMSDVGYFTEPAETKPMLHMWSLAVEEQFYVLFPIYLFLVFKFFKKYLGTLTIVMFLVSLAYSAYIVGMLPGDAFYSTPARAWELMVGSLLAIYSGNAVLFTSRVSNLLTFIGFSLIVYAVVFFDEATAFPGPMALVPVVGSALIILAGNDRKNWVGHLLSTPPLRFIGLISYSLYLWHWPVLAYGRIYSLGSHPDELMPMLLLLMFVLACISWLCIEKPFRRGGLFHSSRRLRLNRFSGTLLISMVAMLVMVTSYQQREVQHEHQTHLEKRVDSQPLRLTSCEEYEASKRSLNICHFGDLSQPQASFALLGDSHARALLSGIDQSAGTLNKKGVFVGNDGCVSLFGVNREKQGFERCREKMDAFKEYLLQHQEIEHVILASRWGVYTTGERYKNTLGDNLYITDDLSDEMSLEENKHVFERGFKRTIGFFKKQDKIVTVITQVPETEYGGWDIVRAKKLGKDIEFRPLLAEYYERQKISLGLFNHHHITGDIQLINLHEFMCGEVYCNMFSEGKSIYIDNNHISRTYADKLSPIYDELFK